MFLGGDSQKRFPGFMAISTHLEKGWTVRAAELRGGATNSPVGPSDQAQPSAAPPIAKGSHNQGTFTAG